MKENKKKKTWWQKLIIFVIVIALICVVFHFAFQYFSSVICENLESIAVSQEYVEKGNEKIEICSYYQDIDTLFDESLILSQYAYEPEDDSTDRDEILTQYGFQNIQHFANKPSQLYKHLSKKDNDASLMFSVVNSTVATKTMDDGNVLIAVAFKGTDSSNLSDDLSDMYKAVDKNGFHEGFMFNAQQFDKKADSIEININGENIKLSQIIGDMKNKDSKYKLLVTGHLLGAAVADIYSGYILQNQGIDNSNLVTVTYGAPKSCSADYVYSGNNIINVINTDDMVPTIGAEEHLGTCLFYTPSEEFRKTNYKEHYVEPNIYNSYSDLLKTAESSLVAHNLVMSYTPLIADIESNHSEFFIYQD